MNLSALDMDRDPLLTDLTNLLVTSFAARHPEGKEINIEIDPSVPSMKGSWLNNGQKEDISLETLRELCPPHTLMRRLRELQSKRIASEFNPLIGSAVIGIIDRVDEDKNVFVSLGSAMAVIPHNHLIPSQTYPSGSLISGAVVKVLTMGSTSLVILSRSNKEYLNSILLNEIPEISQKRLIVHNIARSPGVRAKVLVSSPDLNAIGTVVGPGGNRIRSISNELAGEQIDVVLFDKDISVLIKNCLQPALIGQVKLDYPTRKATCLVASASEMTAAIGGKGLNVKLAAQLTGWSIDIKVG